MTRTEEEIATLRQVLVAKEATASGLKRRLGEWGVVQSKFSHSNLMYKVGLVVWQLGWVDLDLGSSPGW